MRWCSIGIDEEQLRRRSVRSASEWTTTLTTATSRSAINKLATIGADLVRRDVADESICPSIAETITPQFAAAALSATAARGARFKEKYLAIDGGLQI